MKFLPMPSSVATLFEQFDVLSVASEFGNSSSIHTRSSHHIKIILPISNHRAALPFHRRRVISPVNLITFSMSTIYDRIFDRYWQHSFDVYAKALLFTIFTLSGALEFRSRTETLQFYYYRKDYRQQFVL